MTIEMNEIMTTMEGSPLFAGLRGETMQPILARAKKI